MSKLKFSSKVLLVLIVFTHNLKGQSNIADHSKNSKVTAYSVPTELQTDKFTVTINGKTVPVGKAVNMIFYTNFDINGPVEVSVTSSNPRFWDQGVLVSPIIQKIYPKVSGGTIKFTLNGPTKLTIERPGNRNYRWNGGGLDTMLCLLANPPEVNRPNSSDKNVIYLGPGIHTKNIDLHDNQTLYLDGNAFLKGSVNVFDAKNTKIKGRGVIFYSDPSINKCMTVEGNPDRNTRPLTTSGAENLEVDGVIMICRAIRWMVVLNNGTSNVSFNNVKVIGMQEGMDNDYCVDGIDSRGTGTKVNDCFLRCGDNVFGFWGNDFTVTNSYCWTRGANIAMIIWKGAWTANVKDFIIRNCDVVNLDNGLVEINSGKAGGTVDNLVFDNIRCEYMKTIMNITGSAKLTNFTFKKIWIINPQSPGGFLTSNGLGSIDSVIIEKMRFENRIAASPTDAKLEVSKQDNVRFYTNSRNGEPTAIIKTTGKGTVTFSGENSHDTDRGTIKSYEWNFGDGESKFGKTVKHSYAKAGIYRVFLTVTDNDGKSDMTTIAWNNL